MEAAEVIEAAKDMEAADVIEAVEDKNKNQPLVPRNPLLKTWSDEQLLTTLHKMEIGVKDYCLEDQRKMYESIGDWNCIGGKFRTYRNHDWKTIFKNELFFRPTIRPKYELWCKLRCNVVLTISTGKEVFYAKVTQTVMNSNIAHIWAEYCGAPKEKIRMKIYSDTVYNVEVEDHTQELPIWEDEMNFFAEHQSVEIGNGKEYLKVPHQMGFNFFCDHRRFLIQLRDEFQERAPRMMETQENHEINAIPDFCMRRNVKKTTYRMNDTKFAEYAEKAKPDWYQRIPDVILNFAHANYYLTKLSKVAARCKLPPPDLSFVCVGVPPFQFFAPVAIVKDPKELGKCRFHPFTKRPLDPNSIPFDMDEFAAAMTIGKPKNQQEERKLPPRSSSLYQTARVSLKARREEAERKAEEKAEMERAKALEMARNQPKLRNHVTFSEELSMSFEIDAPCVPSTRTSISYPGKSLLKPTTPTLTDTNWLDPAADSNLFSIPSTSGGYVNSSQNDDFSDFVASTPKAGSSYLPVAESKVESSPAQQSQYFSASDEKTAKSYISESQTTSPNARVTSPDIAIPSATDQSLIQPTDKSLSGELCPRMSTPAPELEVESETLPPSSPETDISPPTISNALSKENSTESPESVSPYRISDVDLHNKSLINAEEDHLSFEENSEAYSGKSSFPIFIPGSPRHSIDDMVSHPFENDTMVSETRELPSEESLEKEQESVDPSRFDNTIMNEENDQDSTSRSCEVPEVGYKSEETPMEDETYETSGSPVNEVAEKIEFEGRPPHDYSEDITTRHECAEIVEPNNEESSPTQNIDSILDSSASSSECVLPSNTLASHVFDNSSCEKQEVGSKCEKDRSDSVSYQMDEMNEIGSPVNNDAENDKMEEDHQHEDQKDTITKQQSIESEDRDSSKNLSICNALKKSEVVEEITMEGDPADEDVRDIATMQKSIEAVESNTQESLPKLSIGSSLNDSRVSPELIFSPISSASHGSSVRDSSEWDPPPQKKIKQSFCDSPSFHKMLRPISSSESPSPKDNEQNSSSIQSPSLKTVSRKNSSESYSSSPGLNQPISPNSNSPHKELEDILKKNCREGEQNVGKEDSPVDEKDTHQSSQNSIGQVDSSRRLILQNSLASLIEGMYGCQYSSYEELSEEVQSTIINMVNLTSCSVGYGFQVERRNFRKIYLSKEVKNWKLTRFITHVANVFQSFTDYDCFVLAMQEAELVKALEVLFELVKMKSEEISTRTAHREKDTYEVEENMREPDDDSNVLKEC